MPKEEDKKKKVNCTHNRRLGKRGMGLTDRRKTAKNVVDSCKN